MHLTRRGDAVGRTLGLAVLLASMAPSYGWAAFGQSFTVAVGQRVDYPQVAIDAEGDALIVWNCRDTQGNLRVQARTRSVGGGLGPVQTLSAVGNSAIDPQVVVDADGDALIVWTRFIWPGPASQIQLRTRSKTGALGPIQSVGAGGRLARPQIALDTDGDALIVWSHQYQIYEPEALVLQGRTRSSGGALGPILDLSAGPNGRDAQVAFDPNGNALVVWVQRLRTAEREIWTRAVSAAGTLGPILRLSPSGGLAQAPQLAVDADGDALVVWNRHDGTQQRIQARTRSAAGVPGPIATLSPAGGNAVSPQLGFDAEGDALVVWSRSDGERSHVQARTRSAAGAFGAVRTLSTGGGHRPQVGFDADGDAVIVWQGPYSQVQARTRSAAGALGPVQTISFPGARDPQIAVDPDGDAIAVWHRDAGATERIGAAVGP